jgi:hypothetical protein
MAEARAVARPIERRTADRMAPLLAVAALTGIVGIAVAIAIFPNAWAVDADRNLRAATDLLEGRFGLDHGYVYSPLAAALTVPWTLVSRELAIALWLGLRVAFLGFGAAYATRGWRATDRVLAFVAVASFVPTLYDLLLGNVSILLAGAVGLVASRRDAAWTGIALGLALATVPKPQLIPVLLWMLAYRRRALTGALVSAAIATALAALVLGPDAYGAWIGVLRSVDYLSSPMYGNLSLFAVLPMPIAIAASVAAVIATGVAFTRGPWPGLVAAIALGLLVAPYTLAYAAVLLLVVARPVAEAAPRAAVGLALSGSIAVIVALPVWLTILVATAIATPANRWRPAA